MLNLGHDCSLAPPTETQRDIDDSIKQPLSGSGDGKNTTSSGGCQAYAISLNVGLTLSFEKRSCYYAIHEDAFL